MNRRISFRIPRSFIVLALGASLGGACSDDGADPPAKDMASFDVRSRDLSAQDGLKEDVGGVTDGKADVGGAKADGGGVTGDALPQGDLVAGKNLAQDATVTVSFNEKLLSFLTDGIKEGDKPNCDSYYYWFSKFPKGKDKWIMFTWATPRKLGAVGVDTVALKGPIHPNCTAADAGRTYGNQPVVVQVDDGAGGWIDVATVNGKTGDWSVSFTPRTASKLRLLTAGSVTLTTNPILFEVGISAQ